MGYDTDRAWMHKRDKINALCMELLESLSPGEQISLAELKRQIRTKIPMALKKEVDALYLLVRYRCKKLVATGRYKFVVNEKQKKCITRLS